MIIDVINECDYEVVMNHRSNCRDNLCCFYCAILYCREIIDLGLLYLVGQPGAIQVDQVPIMFGPRFNPCSNKGPSSSKLFIKIGA